MHFQDSHAPIDRGVTKYMSLSNESFYKCYENLAERILKNPVPGMLYDSFHYFLSSTTHEVSQKLFERRLDKRLRFGAAALDPGECDYWSFASCGE